MTSHQSGIEIIRDPFTLVDGGFDPIHPGHIRYFKAACDLGLPVVCLVAQDSYVSTKHKVLLDQESRRYVLSSIRYLDLVIAASAPTWVHLKDLKPTFYFKGKDWRDRLPRKELEICEEVGIQVMFADTPLSSSSEILRIFMEK